MKQLESKITSIKKFKQRNESISTGPKNRKNMLSKKRDLSALPAVNRKSSPKLVDVRKVSICKSLLIISSFRYISQKRLISHFQNLERMQKARIPLTFKIKTQSK